MSKYQCRLCSKELKERFSLRLMQKFDIQYFECSECGCLQTEDPYWLEEAYHNPIRYTDTFTGIRTLTLPPITLLLTKAIKLGCGATLLDWGGGNGLITRMLRDLGLDAYSFDVYEKNTYAAGFEGTLDKNYAIITAFEVLEHMANPGKELSQLFDCNPELIFCTTCLYNGQGPEWSYLAPYSGRHIFFFTEYSLRSISELHGFECIICNSYIVFYRSTMRNINRKFLNWALNDRNQRFIRAWLSIFPPHGSSYDDYKMMRKKVGDY